MEHYIARKHDSLLIGIYSVIKSEKITSRIVNDMYENYNVFKPNVYYIGNQFIKNHNSFLVMDNDTTYLVFIKENDNQYVILDLHGEIKNNLSYISCYKKDNNIRTISMCTYGTIEEIEFDFNDGISFTWK